ncbi:MAG: sensor histidine kinase [Bryobacterales bacterium]|nr:sensor histidine kinase [Bryobacterales bacterium]
MAVVCLVVSLLAGQEVSSLATAVMAVFTAHSTLLAIRGGVAAGVFGLLALFADTVFFLFLVNLGMPAMFWPSLAFYLYLISAALLLYGPREVWLVSSVSLLFVLVARPRELVPAVLVGGVLTSAGAFWKKRLDSTLARALKEAAAAGREAQTARESERQTIAADFHDGPLQSFISFQIRLDILRRVLERDLPAGLEELRQLQELCQSQVRELRSFVRRMRPVDVEASLTAAIRRLADDFRKESGIAVAFVGSDTPVPVAPELSTDVLRMVREALHNVQKHAHATRVAVGVEQSGKELHITIDDNGVGFPFGGVYSLDELDLLRLGPVSIKRRARSIGVGFTLESRPGRGSGLKFKVPV